MASNIIVDGDDRVYYPNVVDYDDEEEYNEEDEEEYDEEEEKESITDEEYQKKQEARFLAMFCLMIKLD